MITLSAHAKINLTFEVLGKRDDRYHNIMSVLQTINLADIFSFEPDDNIRFVCEDQHVEKIKLIEEPVRKAANLLREETGSNRGALIRMQNMGIPRAAGLGSSATGPATALKGLNELWSLGLPLEELSKLASVLGSDTPFFIRGGTALAEGYGEKITPLPSPQKTFLVLLMPPIDVPPNKTAKMYETLNSSHFTSGDFTKHFLEQLHSRKNLQSNLLCNTFECIAFDFFDKLGDYRDQFEEAGARRVHLAGAGPTLFTLVQSEVEGALLASRLKDKGLQACVTWTV